MTTNTTKIAKFEAGKTYFTGGAVAAITITVIKRTAKMIYVESDDTIYVRNARYKISENSNGEFIKLGFYADADWIYAKNEYTAEVKAIDENNKKVHEEYVMQVQKAYDDAWRESIESTPTVTAEAQQIAVDAEQAQADNTEAYTDSKEETTMTITTKKASYKDAGEMLKGYTFNFSGENYSDDYKVVKRFFSGTNEHGATCFSMIEYVEGGLLRKVRFINNYRATATDIEIINDAEQAQADINTAIAEADINTAIAEADGAPIFTRSQLRKMIDSVLAERDEFCDALDEAEADEEISQHHIDYLREEIEKLTDEYWKLCRQFDNAPSDDPSDDISSISTVSIAAKVYDQIQDRERRGRISSSPYDKCLILDHNLRTFTRGAKQIKRSPRRLVAYRARGSCRKICRSKHRTIG